MLNLKKFNSPMPVGVRLPRIEVDRKVYYQLDLDPKSSNYELLRALCLRGVKERGIDKFKNKQEYYDRVKVELSVLNDLGFVDYILLNWDILNFCHYKKDLDLSKFQNANSQNNLLVSKMKLIK